MMLLAALAILLLGGLALQPRSISLANLAAVDEPVPSKVTGQHFSADGFLEPIKYLSSDGLQGRGNGTPFLDMAAGYIADQFRRMGLKPLGDEQTYLQHFNLPLPSQLASFNSLTLVSGDSKKPFSFGRDFIPLNFSDNATLSAPLVFVGYGITAPEYHYDDYEGVDVKGKVVLMLRHEPQEHDEKSIFAGKEFTVHADILHKAINARDHGAAGMILVNDAGNHPGDSDSLIPFGTITGPEKLRIAALHMRAERADDWVKPSGHTLDELRQAIDRDLSNHSFALDPPLQVQLRTDIVRVRKPVANVIGELPGRDSAAGCIVIGAHYDHLGRGDPNLLRLGLIGEVRHGADDNASGTSGLLQLASWWASLPKRPAHSLVFVAFADKEAGLRGSSYYTTHPACPLERTLAMLNLDMIGRVRENRLYIGGTGTAAVFRKRLEDANRGVGLDLNYSSSDCDASDHISFMDRGIPVLFFSSGLHSDYQKPSDTWEKINALDGVRVLDLAANVIESLDGLRAKPKFVQVAEPHSSMDGGAHGSAPYFGVVPDFSEEEQGVRIADLRKGAPAAKAGFRGGDTLVQFGEKKIENLYDFTYALGDHKPGDEVRVTVLRDGQPVTRVVLLEVRE